MGHNHVRVTLPNGRKLRGQCLLSSFHRLLAPSSPHLYRTVGTMLINIPLRGDEMREPEITEPLLSACSCYLQA